MKILTAREFQHNLYSILHDETKPIQIENKGRIVGVFFPSNSLSFANKALRKVGVSHGVQPAEEESTSVSAKTPEPVRENVPLSQETPPEIKIRNYCDICRRQAPATERSFFDGVDQKKAFICNECWDKRPSEMKPAASSGGLVREPSYAVPKFVGSNPKPKPKKKGGANKWRK